MNDLTLNELLFLELAACARTRELLEWCHGDEELEQKQKDYLRTLRLKLNTMQEALMEETPEEEEPPFGRFSY